MAPEDFHSAELTPENAREYIVDSIESSKFSPKRVILSFKAHSGIYHYSFSVIYNQENEQVEPQVIVTIHLKDITVLQVQNGDMSTITTNAKDGEISEAEKILAECLSKYAIDAGKKGIEISRKADADRIKLRQSLVNLQEEEQTLPE